ncbi:hypothetical protein Dip510_001343 [Elusimicrobium posterum]
MFAIKELRRREIKLTDVARKNDCLDIVLALLSDNLEHILYNMISHATSERNLALIKYLVEDELFSHKYNDDSILDSVLGQIVFESSISDSWEIMDYLLTEENCRKHIDRHILSHNVPDGYKDFWLECLYLACVHNNLDTVKYILDRNLVDDNAASKFLGGQSLLEAAEGNPAVMDYLAKHCTNKNLNNVYSVNI